MCDYAFLGICLTRPPADSGFAIFGFSEFLAALALLVLVFSSSDFLYQFRVSVAAIHLKLLSFVATVLIGAGTLLTDLWFAERWYALPWGVSRATLQGFFGALFLSTVLLWIWFAFVKPPIFSRWNYKHFYGELFRSIVRGSDSQLPIVGSEMARSGPAIIRFAHQRPLLRRPHRNSPREEDGGKEPEREPDVSDYARQALQMLGSRKLCRHIVASSPITAIVLMEEAAKQGAYRVPLGEFARNATEEALKNRDSILYHEDRYGSDVLRWMQPFSKAMYGNYRLVEGISSSGNSPLDIDYRLAWKMDREQFEAYCNITLLTFKSYIEGGHYHSHSYVLFRALEVIKEAGRELYKLDNQPTSTADRTRAERMSAAVAFISDVISFLGEQEDLDFGHLRMPSPDSGVHRANIFDYIAEAMFDMVFDASAVRSPPDQAWWIQYNTVWGRFFGLGSDSKAWNVIRFKFSRLVFDEIKRLGEFPNYKGARLLSICLNVMGLSLSPPAARDRGEHRLHKAVLGWTRRNYMRLAEVHPPVAEFCLSGGVTFEPQNQRLVKTFLGGLELEPSRQYLRLNPPPSVTDPKP